MRKWMAEDWEFEAAVTSGIARNCRLGLEEGDRFTFQYECPACEVIRCGGDFTYRGCKEKYELDFSCPCQCVHFHLTAKPINRDENGVYNGKSERPKEK
jgi:hypothetical protein